MTSIAIERRELPAAVLKWLEDEMAGETIEISVLFSEDGKVIFRRSDGEVDPAMMERVRKASERYHSALERLADS